MYIYPRMAIDSWAGWLTETQYIAQLRELNKDYGNPDAAIKEYRELKETAFELALKAGWEGDVRDEPHVAGLPGAESQDDGHIMIAWKQDNNGDTFVASPFKLTWFKD